MTSKNLIRVFASFTFGALAFTLAGCDKPDLSTSKGKYSYAIGVQIGKNLKQQNIDLDPVSFAAGVKDVYKGTKPKLNGSERMAALQEMTTGLQKQQTAEADANKKKGDDFLAQNKTKPGWKVTASGLQYQIVREGKGKAPTKNDTVEVNYEGRLIDGTVFDSSYKRNQPATFPVGAVIPGWTEALQLMKPGSEFELALPPELAYGAHGSSMIPPNSVLLFKVELLKVMPGPSESHHAKSAKHGAKHKKKH